MRKDKMGCICFIYKTEDPTRARNGNQQLSYGFLRRRDQTGIIDKVKSSSG